MIRIVASTILERPILARGRPTKEQLIKQHIRELPNMIRYFRNAIVSVSRESKWCKLALLRSRVPLEIFSLIQPYLIREGEKDFYPCVAYDQWVAPRKYLLIEAKLYRLELVHDETLYALRNYITDCDEFRDESRNQNWQLRQLIPFDKKIEFIRHVLMLRFHMKNTVLCTEYDTEYMLRYWM